MKIQRVLKGLGFELEEYNGDLFLYEIGKEQDPHQPYSMIAGDCIKYSLAFYKNNGYANSKAFEAIKAFDKYIEDINSMLNSFIPSVIKVMGPKEEHPYGQISHNSIYIRDNGKILFLPLYISKDRRNEYLYSNVHSSELFNMVRDYIM